MKMTLLLFLSFTLCAVEAQTNDITGFWITETGEGIVEVYSENGKYYGRLVSLKNPHDENGNAAVDIKNPNKSLRTRRLVGILILDSFEYNKEQRDWENGKVYDPNMGHEANGILSLVDSETLKVKGYVGFKWISKSETWKRTSKKHF